jgi:hypothetical protein
MHFNKYFKLNMLRVKTLRKNSTPGYVYEVARDFDR